MAPFQAVPAPEDAAAAKAKKRRLGDVADHQVELLSMAELWRQLVQIRSTVFFTAL